MGLNVDRPEGRYVLDLSDLSQRGVALELAVLGMLAFACCSSRLNPVVCIRFTLLRAFHAADSTPYSLPETLFGSVTFGNGAAARELSRKASGSDPSEWWKVCRKVAGKDAGSKVEMDPWPLTPWLIKPFSASDADDSLYPLPVQVPTERSLAR